MPEKPHPCLDPIGVFDSGIGGLTVVAALQDLLPSETIFYIGDTARVPYGGKSRKTVERYSIEIGGLLLAEQAKILVVDAAPRWDLRFLDASIRRDTGFEPTIVVAGAIQTSAAGR